MYLNIIKDIDIPSAGPDLKLNVGGQTVVMPHGVLRYDMGPFFQNGFALGSYSPDGTLIPYPKGVNFWNIKLSSIPSNKFIESANKALAAGDIIAAVFYLYAVPMIEKDITGVDGNAHPNGAANVPCPNADQYYNWQYDSYIKAYFEDKIGNNVFAGYSPSDTRDPNNWPPPNNYYIGLGEQPPPVYQQTSLLSLEGMGSQNGFIGPYTDDVVFGFIYWNSSYIRVQDFNQDIGGSNFFDKYMPDIIDTGIVVLLAVATFGVAAAVAGAAAGTTAVAGAGVATGSASAAADAAAGTTAVADAGVATGSASAAAGAAAGTTAVAGAGVATGSASAAAGATATGTTLEASTVASALSVAASVAGKATGNTDLSVAGSLIGIASGNFSNVSSDISAGASLVNDYNALTKNPGSSLNSQNQLVNAQGQLINPNGQLVDANGNVIPTPTQGVSPLLILAGIVAVIFVIRR